MIDARPEDDFYQHSLTSSHIAPPIYQKNVPAELLTEECGALKSDKELAKVFLKQDIDTYTKTIILCNSNHKDSSLVKLCLHLMGNENSSIFWGGQPAYISHKEPNFNMGGFRQSVSEHFDTIIMQQPDEEIKKYLARKQWHREMASAQDKAEQIYEEQMSRSKFNKYDTSRVDYDSWEQSDYELDESDINPTMTSKLNKK